MLFDCMRILAFDRPGPLRDLLHQLDSMHFGPVDGAVVLKVIIDAPSSPRVSNSTLARINQSIDVAHTMPFSHGTKEVVVRSAHAGLLYQWWGAWDPDEDNSDACLILEDDVLPSQHTWLWVSHSLETYRSNLDTVASFGLQRQMFVPVAPKSAQCIAPALSPGLNTPYLYQQYATWGFVAMRKAWSGFRKWLPAHAGLPPSALAVFHNGKPLQHSQWLAERKGRVWSPFFVRFMSENELFTLYPPPLPKSATLCANARVRGLNHPKNMGHDFPLLRDNVSALWSVPPFASLPRFGWDACPIASEVVAPSSSQPSSSQPSSSQPSSSQPNGSDVLRLTQQQEVTAPGPLPSIPTSVAALIARMPSTTRRLVVTAITTELFDFATHHLCGLASHLPADAAALVISMDSSSTCNELAVWLQRSPTLLCASDDNAELSGGSGRTSGYVKFRSEFYMRATTRRLALFTKLAQDVRFEQILFMDVDVVLYANPFSAVNSSSTHLLVFTQDQCFKINRAIRAKSHQQFLNSGLLFVKPGPGASHIMGKALENIRARLTYDGTDQGAYQHLLDQQIRSGSARQIGLIPCSRGIPGHVLPYLHFDEHGQPKVDKLQSNQTIVTLHMNWVRSSSRKQECLMVTGQWLARPPPQLCAPIDPSAHRHVQFQFEPRSGNLIIGRCSKGHANDQNR